MYRFIVKSISYGLALASLFSGTAFLLRAAARQQDLPPQAAILLPDPDCPSPCWNGIQPQNIRYSNLQNLTAHLSPQFQQTSPTTWTFSTDGIQEHRVVFNPPNAQISYLPEGLHLGDLIPLYGLPEYIGWIASYNGKRSLVSLYYPDHQVIVMVWLAKDQHISPNNKVYAVNMSEQYRPPPLPNRDFPQCVYVSVFLC